MKKSIELLEQINSVKVEVKALAENGSIEDAEAKMKELEDMQKRYEIMKAVEDAPINEAELKEVVPVNPITEEPKDAIHEFAQAARSGFKVTNTAPTTNNEGSGIQGAYTVPEDIQTKINQWKEARFSLRTLVDSENVSTMSGARTFQKKATQTGFSSVNEGAAIGAKAGPQFERITYNITKYAGYLPVTNELLADSDANIANVLIEWLGREAIATENSLILTKINTKAATTFTGIDSIKNAINVTLGQAYAGDVVIVTNDSGLNWMDTLKDENNRYLLQPSINPVEPMQMYLAVGARRIPLIVVPNAILANDTTSGTKCPIIVGDLKEYCKIFDRAQLSILTSNIASVGSGDDALNAFEQDLTLFRGIMRLDCVVKDSGAIVRGLLSLG